MRYLPAAGAYVAAPFIAHAAGAWGPVLAGLLALVATAWALLDT